METYTRNETTWKLLRPITIKELILAGADDHDTETLATDFDLTWPIPLPEVIDYASSNPQFLQKIVDKGFVEKVEEKLKPCPFCGGKAVWTCGAPNWIMCSKCNADGRLRDSRKAALDHWNKRQ